MKILSAKQIQDLDAYTIKHRNIESIDLMETAAAVFYNWFIDKINYRNQDISIVCGRGNNGGDGLAVARMLHAANYKVKVLVLEYSDSTSLDFRTNLYKYQQLSGAPIKFVYKDESLDLGECDVIIDAIFGTGLNRAVEGKFKEAIEIINASNKKVYAIDIASGLLADDHSVGIAVEADHVLSFQLPKLAFMFPENQKAIHNWEIQSIGLVQDKIDSTSTKNYYVDKALAQSLVLNRNKFDHKGNYGHACIVGGSHGMMGALILASSACMRTGSGLLSVQVPGCGYTIIQTKLPEAMVNNVSGDKRIDEIKTNPIIDAYGIGPGLGTHATTKEALSSFLKAHRSPMVLDADALNIIAANQELLNHIPEHSILTPHVKEFERLFGRTATDFDRNRLQKLVSAKYKIYVLLKGAHSCSSTPSGECYFNSTGNNGMATAGSGDVLTGIITSLLTQGYDSEAACILGAYIHGLAGDHAAAQVGHRSLIASDIVNNISSAFKSCAYE